MDLYKTLGIKRNATQDEIKIAYRSRAKKYHPDRNGGEDRKFKDVQQAYDVLSNESQRIHYDQTGEIKDSISREDMEILQCLSICLQNALNQFAGMGYDPLHVDLKKQMMVNINQIIQNGKSSRESMEKRKLDLQKVMDRFYPKDTENHMKAVCKGQIGEADRQIAAIQISVNAAMKAKEHLAKYDFQFDGFRATKTFTILEMMRND